MINLIWKQVIYNYIIKQYLKKYCNKFIRDYVWFGWWWASYCSAHNYYELDCETCKAGNWTKSHSWSKKSNWRKRIFWTIRKR